MKALRRVVAVTAALAAVAFAGLAMVGDPRVVVVPTSQGATTTTASPPSTVAEDVLAEPVAGLRFIALTDSELVSIDADSNAVSSVEHDLGPSSEAWQRPTLIVSGSSVFVLANGKLRSALTTVEGGLRDLGAGLVMVRSSTDGNVWVARERDAGYVLDEIDATGRVHRTSRQLPVDSVPHAVVDDHIVLAAPAGILAWHPMTGNIAWRGGFGNVVAVSDAAGWVAWMRGCDSPLCVVHLSDVSSGRERTVRVGSLGVDAWAGFAVDPTGRYLAATSNRPSGNDRPAFVFHVVDLETTLITEAETLSIGPALWSPDGKWVFLQGFQNFGGVAALAAFRVDGSEIRAVDARLPIGIRPVALALAMGGNAQG